MNHHMLSLLQKVALVIFGISLLAPLPAFAGNTKTVKRGNQSSQIVLNWNVLGGGGTCSGTTDYPDRADNIRYGWITGTRNNAGNTSSIGGSPAWGTKIYAPAKASPGYFFSCQDAISGQTDTAYLIVTDCLAGETWTGTDCVVTPTGSLSVSPSSCTIATGASSCNTNFTWSTTNPIGTSAITTNYPVANTVAASANSGTAVAIAVAGPPGTKTFYLYNSGVQLDSKTVTTSCAVGGWDTVSGTCRDPRTTGPKPTCNFYCGSTPTFPGDPLYPADPSIQFTCTNSNSYTIKRPDGTTMATGAVTSSPQSFSIPISPLPAVSGTYLVICSYGSVDNQTPISYSATPDPTTINAFTANPVSIATDEKITITWDVSFPPTTPVCTLTGTVVCPNGACSVAQQAYQTSLTNTLTNGYTETTPVASRLVPIAVSKVPNSYLLNDPPIYKAVGKKFVVVSYTTDFTYQCGATKSVRRVRVTKNQEQ